MLNNGVTARVQSFARNANAAAASPSWGGTWAPFRLGVCREECCPSVQCGAVLGIGGQRGEAEKAMGRTCPSTTAWAGSEPGATQARRSDASPRLHAGRTQSGLGPLSGGVRRHTGRPPLPMFDAPPGLRTCWQRSQHVGRRYARLRYAGCNCDHVSRRRSLLVDQPASLGAGNAFPGSSVSWPAACVSPPRSELLEVQLKTRLSRSVLVRSHRCVHARLHA